MRKQFITHSDSYSTILCLENTGTCCYIAIINGSHDNQDLKKKGKSLSFEYYISVSAKTYFKGTE